MGVRSARISFGFKCANVGGETSLQVSRVSPQKDPPPVLEGQFFIPGPELNWIGPIIAKLSIET